MINTSDAEDVICDTILPGKAFLNWLGRCANCDNKQEKRGFTKCAGCRHGQGS